MLEERVFLTGETYPVREQLKALGARWDPQQRAWSLPKDRLPEAQALLTAGSPQKSGMVGELWQECRISSCTSEPVCIRCHYCDRHCTC